MMKEILAMVLAGAFSTAVQGGAISNMNTTINSTRGHKQDEKKVEPKEKKPIQWPTMNEGV